MTWQLRHAAGSSDRYEVPSAYEAVKRPSPTTPPNSSASAALTFRGTAAPAPGQRRAPACGSLIEPLPMLWERGPALGQHDVGTSDLGLSMTGSRPARSCAVALPAP